MPVTRIVRVSTGVILAVDTGTLAEGEDDGGNHRAGRNDPAETTQAETTQAELVIGGMTCAACAARVQAKLNKLTGVTASVNLSTERAYVSAPPALPVDALIGVVQAAGYTAELARPAEPDAEAGQARESADAAAVRRLRRRLIVALVFFVPLTDLSLLLSLVPCRPGSPAGSGSWSRWPRRWRCGRRGRSTAPR